MRSLIITLVAATSISAQSLSSRIASAPDGVVRMQFDARPGTCGDGRDMVGYRHALFMRDMQSFGKWSAPRCVPGPLRVTLSVDRGEVVRVRTQVGGDWPSTSGRATDLGDVSSREASAYLFSLVPRLETSGGKDRLLIPAVLADDAEVVQPLIALARDADRANNTRRSAVMWLGIVGDASVVPVLVAIARESDGQKKDLGGTAMAALSTLEDGVGVPALIDLAHAPNLETRRSAVFWLGQNGDPRALRTLNEVIANEKEDERVRSHAIFSLSQAGEAATSDLVRIYRDIDNRRLREQTIFGLSQRSDDAATDELIRIAREDKDRELRSKALFWLAQKDDPRVRKLISDIILR